MNCLRFFRPVKGKFNVILPKRMSKGSAAYDFFCPCDLTLPPKRITPITTNVAAMMLADDVLSIFIRSSLACKNVVLRNSVAIIDSDFINSSSDGNIILLLFNDNDTPFVLHKGERIAQGIFHKFFTTFDDDASGNRLGGLGSTGS